MVGEAARAYTVAGFDKAFNEIVKIDMVCADYLLGIGLEHWARSHFPGKRYNYMTSNIAESWNAVLREARGFPIISLVEYTVNLNDVVCGKKRRCNVEEGTLTPKIQKMLA